MNAPRADPAHQPELTETRKRWKPYIYSILLIMTVPYPLAWLMANYGTWIGLVLAGGVGVAFHAYEARTERLILAEVRARLMDREPIEVDRQVADLVRTEIVPNTLSGRVIRNWLDAGKMLRLDPARLRWEDCIWKEYRSLARKKVPRHVDWLIEDLGDLTDGSIWFRKTDSADTARERCIKCKYDVTGLAQAAPCPECGTRSFTIQTLGDVLLISSGKFGGVDLNYTLEGRRVTQV